MTRAFGLGPRTVHMPACAHSATTSRSQRPRSAGAASSTSRRHSTKCNGTAAGAAERGGWATRMRPVCGCTAAAQTESNAQRHSFHREKRGRKAPQRVWSEGSCVDRALLPFASSFSLRASMPLRTRLERAEWSHGVFTRRRAYTATGAGATRTPPRSFPRPFSSARSR